MLGVDRSAQSLESCPRGLLTRGLTAFLAAATGLSVANLYYAQPLLRLIGRSFSLPASSTALVVTLTQLGYTFGLLLFVPLADRMEQRRLVVVLSAATAAALLAIGASRSLQVLELSALLMGAATVVPQVLLPMAAGLARPQRRGQVVGVMMSGLLLGALAARVVAGIAGAALGWRAVFDLAAGAMAGLAVGLYLFLPERPAQAGASLRQLMRSLGGLVAHSAPLRKAALTGGALFGCFSAFWTLLTPHLAAQPFGYSSAQIGLFGLVGIAGAAVAPFAGRLADRLPAHRLVLAAMAAAAVSAIVLLCFGATLPGILAGIVLLDASVQSGHIANQSRVFSEQPEAHGRRNTVYMVSYFAGGALGSAASLVLYRPLGWAAVPLVQFGLLALGVIGQALA